MEGADKSSGAKMGTSSAEESSWTFYIQGFICDHNNDDDDDDDEKNTTCFSSEFESPSLVSDAASSAVKKLANTCNWTEEGDVGFSSGKTNTPRTVTSKQNSFKKQKAKVIPAMDYELEDTASSPLNSPKVSYMNHFMNQKGKANMDVSEVMKRNTFGKGGVFAVERDSNYADLKKKSCG